MIAVALTSMPDKGYRISPPVIAQEAYDKAVTAVKRAKPNHATVGIQSVSEALGKRVNGNQIASLIVEAAKIKLRFFSDAPREMRVTAGTTELLSSVEVVKGILVERETILPPNAYASGKLSLTIERIKGPNAVVSDVEVLSSDSATLGAVPPPTTAMPRLSPRLVVVTGVSRKMLDLAGSWRYANGELSDSRKVRFGVRQIAVKTDPSFSLKINCKPIFPRGGSWGMDDAMKRVSKERLEPFIRLQHDANLNMIRTWSGQSIEPALFELCDECGIMVWCEFWMTTGGTNYEPLDEKLMQENLKDGILRYRNTPSIVVWQGRNEAPPPPETDAYLREITSSLDGTRHYQGSSVGTGMGHSGPWGWQATSGLFSEAN